MFIALSIIQFLVGFDLLFLGFTFDPYGAPQQTVQYIQFLIAAVLIVGGIITLAISVFSKRFLTKLNEQNDFLKTLVKEESETRKITERQEMKQVSKIADTMEPVKVGYEFIQVNGKMLTKGKGSTLENYYCPFCYKKIDSTMNSCTYCGKQFPTS